MRQRAQSRRRVRRGNNKTWSYHSTEPWQQFLPCTPHRSRFLALIKKGAPAFVFGGCCLSLFIIIIVYFLTASKVLAFASHPRDLSVRVCSPRPRSQFPATAIQSCDKLKRCSPPPTPSRIPGPSQIAKHRTASHRLLLRSCWR